MTEEKNRGLNKSFFLMRTDLLLFFATFIQPKISDGICILLKNDFFPNWNYQIKTLFGKKLNNAKKL